MDWSNELELAARQHGTSVYRRNYRRCRKQQIGLDDCIQDARLSLCEMLAPGCPQGIAIALLAMVPKTLPKGSSIGENTIRGLELWNVPLIAERDEYNEKNQRRLATIQRLAKDHPPVSAIIGAIEQTQSTRPRDLLHALPGWTYGPLVSWLRSIEQHLLRA